MIIKGSVTISAVDWATQVDQIFIGKVGVMGGYGIVSIGAYPSLGLENFIVKPGLLWQAAVHLVI